MQELYSSVFFVGIKGVAMANLARICSQMGKKVSGSDVDEEFITDAELESITVIPSFAPQSLPLDVDLIIYSAAHGGTNNPQVQEAKKRGIHTLHQAEFIGELIKQFKTSVAVAGCHGKTTTSALLAYALTKLGKNPSYMVGVSTFNELFGGEFGSKDYFVLEADEYGLNPPENKTPKFHFFHPTYALITNIDFDHPDVFDDMYETKKAFKTFISNILHDSKTECLVICADDDAAMEVASQLDRTTYLTYGRTIDADVSIQDLIPVETGMKFTLHSKRLNISDSFVISLYGEKNVLNATAAIAMLRLLDFSLTQIQTAIEDFAGAKRRFELLYTVGDTYIFDDYAHHPNEIQSTIQAARMRFSEKRIIVLFQPHTFSRTESLKDEFVDALAKADISLIAPIFGSARESVHANAITSAELAVRARKKGITSIEGFESTDAMIKVLKNTIKKGDIIFTMGAGDIYKLAPEIKKLLE